MSKKVLFWVFLGFIIISACSPTANPKPVDIQITDSPTVAEGYPASPTIDMSSAYPALATPIIGETKASEEDHYVLNDDSALLALPVALQEAKKWRPNAVFYQILRLRQMEQNLSLPTGPAGWFFAFMDTDGSAVELYVEVINREVIGKTEVQQLFPEGKPPYQLTPIDISKKMLDHKDVYQIFLSNIGNEYIKGKGRVELDFQLVQLEGMENPVWSIFDTADLNAPPLASIDAVTGKMTDDPFAFLRK
jgi:hypothetical protein